MNRLLLLLVPISGAALLFAVGGCATTSQNAAAWETRLGPVPETPQERSALVREVKVRRMLIPRGRYGRRRPLAMRPRYITIHSTQNPTGDAFDHAKALQRGALRGGRRSGYLYWHFTVQDSLVVQHLPTNEAGEHADLDGPGNRYSIGIEMTEHKGNDLARTIDRTAKLTALLMKDHRIPIDRVVPHYHWPREGYDPPHKNCPHFLLDHGRPRGTWQWFKSRVQRHYERLDLAEEMAQEGAPNRRLASSG